MVFSKEKISKFYARFKFARTESSIDKITGQEYRFDTNDMNFETN